MVRANILAIIGFFATLLKAQANIFQPITPKISWSNIGIEPPKITIFFQSDFNTKGTMTDFWVKLSIPFLAYKLNPVWSMIPPDSCSTDDLTYYTAIEERTEANEIWTTFYVQLKGSTYYPSATYSLKFQPDRYMDFEGYSDSIKIAFISQNVDGHIIYAYNNAFNCLYGVQQPNRELIVNDYTDDPDKEKLNKIIDSYIIVQIKDNVGERILLKASGDYTFADDTEIK